METNQKHVCTGQRMCLLTYYMQKVVNNWMTWKFKFPYERSFAPVLRRFQTIPVVCCSRCGVADWYFKSFFASIIGQKTLPKKNQTSLKLNFWCLMCWIFNSVFSVLRPYLYTTIWSTLICRNISRISVLCIIFSLPALRETDMSPIIRKLQKKNTFQQVPSSLPSVEVLLSGNPVSSGSSSKEEIESLKEKFKASKAKFVFQEWKVMKLSFENMLFFNNCWSITVFYICVFLYSISHMRENKYFVGFPYPLLFL